MSRPIRDSYTKASENRCGPPSKSWPASNIIRPQSKRLHEPSGHQH